MLPQAGPARERAASGRAAATAILEIGRVHLLAHSAVRANRYARRFPFLI